MSLDLTLYLRLTPEFGGTEFGPYDEVEILLGSDPDSTRIYIRPEFGILPQHVRVFRQGHDNLILAPSERTAGVFLFRGGGNRPTQVTSPTAIQSGDQFSLVSPGGPRFEVELAPHPDRVAEAEGGGVASKTRKKLPNMSAFTAEGRRQLFTTLLVTGPAQIAQRAYTFVKSGAIFMPRNIILGITMLGGYVFGGVQSCDNRKMKADLVVKNTRVENCNKELSFAENLNKNSSDYSFEQLMATLSGSLNLGQALEEDDALRAMVKKKAKTAFANGQRFRWLINGKSASAGRFADWRERVDGEDSIDQDTRNLLIWLAGTPAKRNSDFADVTDSEGDEVCARGPIQMTYRQAVSFGMDTQADALVTKNYQATAEDKTKREALLGETAAAAGTELPEDNFETDVDPVSQGRAGCLYVQGGDDRSGSSALVRTLSRHLGDSADGVPLAGDPMGSVARLAKFWSADMTRVDFRGADIAIDFDGSQVGAVLDGYDRRGQWVLERTADTIARSVVVPCLAVMREDEGDLVPTFGENLPSPVSCLVLEWKLRNQK